MILINLLETERNPLNQARRFVLWAFPFFVGLVVVASWPVPPTVPVAELRPATPEEKETVVESLGRLPGYYQRLETISANIIDELVFERATLKVKNQKQTHVDFHDDSMTVSEGFFKTDPRSQAQALSTAIAPHQELRDVVAPDLAIKGE